MSELEELKEVLENTKGFIRKQSEDEDGFDYSPMLHVSTKDKDGERKDILISIAGDFNEKDHKQKSMGAIGAMMHKQGLEPMHVTMSSEAWMVKLNKDSDPSEIKGSLADRDDRIEIIQISCMSADMVRIASHATISRDSLPVLGEFSDFEGGSMNLLELFYEGYHKARFNK